jgi:hypothetical protein
MSIGCIQRSSFNADGKDCPMGRTLLNCSDTYDPDTLRLLGRAFDAAWREVSNGGRAAEAEDRRTRLALIILAVAGDGARDEVEIKQAAVHIMNSREVPYRNFVRH